ncbi:YD repeat-containing protein [Croceifilum oryzae]|uniref:YD repeat-containing protein n=1 Tax=Croceifilum oryzae TaxID=1553429 RepID=A0AAJ1WSD6_9BACL|nr:DNRLRE domain-containing protein [Croceifilum oryzae]MDQ0417595.1 YD repeat-containing protein [Croceifilum oryzae]
MKKIGNRCWIILFVLMFWFVGLGPTPVMAAEAWKEWSYQRSLLVTPANANQEKGFFDKVADFFTGDDEEKDSKSKNPNIPVHTNSLPNGKVKEKAKRVKELVDERRPNAKFHQLSDGKIEAEISPTPIHYKDSSGKWQDIKKTITTSKQDVSYGFANTTNSFQTYFGNQTSGSLVKVKSGAHQLEMGLLEGKTIEKQPTVKENQITYPEVKPDMKVEYQMQEDAVKESIIFDRVPDTFTYQFKLNLEGLTATQQKDGSIKVESNKDGRIVFTIPKPFMMDSKPNQQSPYGKEWSPNVTQTIEQKGSEATLTIQADEKWLKDSARQFPVILDPTIIVQPPPTGNTTNSQDTMITNASPDSNFYSSWNLATGTDKEKISRSLVKFDLSSIPAGTSIDAARVELYYDQQFGGDNEVDFSMHRMMQDWDPKTATWNQAQTGVPWNKANGVDTGSYQSSLEHNTEVVDDHDSSNKAVMNGQWGSMRSDSSHDGSFFMSPSGSGSDTFTWIPKLTESGKYELQMWYPAGFATNAPYTVHHANGTTNLSVDQSKEAGKWSTKGTFEFQAGNSNKIVLNNKADNAVYADAMRLIKYSVDTKKKAVGNQTHSFTARSLVQDWINGTQPNYGVMVKAKDESKRLGGVNYTASSDDFFGQDQDQIRPKLVVTYGKPGVVLDQPTKLHATGAELSWSKYTGGDFVEYQVHRSTEQNFVPDETTLIAPIEKLDQLAYTDTTSPAVPAMSDNNRVNRDPEYYYMIAVKTSDGDLVGTDTKFVRLPKAGQIRQIVKAGKDTSISSGKPTEALDSIWGNNWLVAGNHHARYGDIRSLVHFDTSELPTGVKVTSARMGLWSWLMESEDPKASPANYRVHPLQSDFTEDTTWNTSGKGGNYGPHIDQQKANSEVIPNAPHWTYWDTTSTVQSWLKGTTVNKGLLVKSADELRENGEIVYFLSSEASARSLRPQLEVTYTDESAGSSYYAPSTPSVMSPGNDYEVFVTVTNTTEETWRGGSNHLSYHWVDSTGKEVSISANQAKTTFRPVDENGIEYPDPVDIKPGQSIKVRAKVIAPTLSSSNLREEFTLRWDILQDSKNWLSQSEKPVATLNQKVAVEKDKTEKNLGEAATHIKENSGPNSVVGANLFKGNFAYSFTPFKHATKGFTTYATLTYNSLNDQSTIMGKGWSLDTNSMMSIGAPMSNVAQIETKTDKIVSGSVVLIDDEGSSHTFTYDKNKKKFVPPSGTNLTLQYQSGKGGSIEQRKWIVSGSDQQKYYFNRDGYVTEVVDRNGNKSTFTYEKKKIDNKDTHVLKYMTDTSGRQVLTFTYTSKNQLQYIDDLVGGRTALHYDSDGRLVKIVDGIDKSNGSESLARTYQFTYHATKKNMMTGVIDPRGNKTSVQYIESGTDANKIGEWINRDGKSTYFNYNGNEVNVTDAKDRKTRYLFDSRGRNTSFTNAMNQTTKYAYDDDDNLIRTEEPNGAVSTTTYDPHNHGLPVTKMDQVNNALTDSSARKASKNEYKYSDDYTSALLTKTTSPEGKTITYTHDKNGNVISEKDSMGNETKISYYITDAKGKAIDTTDPNAAGTNTGLLKTKTDANGKVTTYGDPSATDLGYDPNGKPKKVKDPLGNVTTFTYGPLGEVLTTTDAKGNTTTVTYNLLGDVVKTVAPKDQLNREFITTPGPVLDKNGNVLSQTTPAGAETKSEYDKMDRVIKTILPKDDNSTTERVKTFTYNEVGKLVKETEPNGNVTPDNADDFSTSYEHNALDQVTTITNAKGDQIKQEYDNVGNLIKVTQPLGVLTADPDDYSVKKEYDLNHRVIKETDAKGKYVLTEYGADGQVTRTRDKEGNFKYNYYDARGLLTESRYQHDKDKVRITKYRYDKMGNQTEVETPRGVETPNEGDFVLKKSYDALNRVSETFFSYDPTSVNTRFREQHSIRYKYDSTGNVVEVSTPPTEGSNTRNTATFTYYENGLIKQIQDPWKTKTNYQYNGATRF